MLGRSLSTGIAGVMVVIGTAGVWAQMPNSYGEPVTLEVARKTAAIAVAEARKNSWNMAVAIVDMAGDLVYFEKMDATQTGSVDVSIAKARSAVRYKRPTKAFEDVLAGGGVGLRILGLEGAVPVDGGLPLVANGKIIGGIGVSGATSQQDGVVAKAGADTVK
jgi:glc operon protein GlcG